MSKKLYYTNPLHAAIMEEQFGVKLGLDCAVISDDDSEERTIYIHPDSYHVFEPMELDFGLSNKDIQYQFEDGRWLWANQEELDDNEVVEIIHRNFKPFFTPEEEAA